MLDAGWASPDQVVLVEVSAVRAAELTGEGGLAHRFPGLQVLNRRPPPAKGAVLAVKPADIEVSLPEPGRYRRQSGAVDRRRVTLSDLESFCPAGCAVVRAMPNIAALVRAGATAISPGSLATPDDLEWAAGIMRSVGLVVEVPEKLLDAVTGLSGSGPAYVFVIVEAMTEAGVLVGLAPAGRPRPRRPDLARVGPAPVGPPGRALRSSGPPSPPPGARLPPACAGSRPARPVRR